MRGELVEGGKGGEWRVRPLLEPDLLRLLDNVLERNEPEVSLVETGESGGGVPIGVPSGEFVAVLETSVPLSLAGRLEDVLRPRTERFSGMSGTFVEPEI
ncbi:hypothetical protein PHYBLDRAFT_157601 [Phycomyces blakesleeanus NRRL 1555(-)]|uniref:Uncharacterized protein n=1 Tax=Phycomyces blakesleeanus (strain ATCC 8743b / DSM 1359 / FGSC 10004 / NBRC 33097 / NRRL 1555) TaxID=763407 RepID=A0A163B7B2_PHYB8|nr:hypothetical protein PHYBLDRAFT_157601 [Phycomyces blakesleeanus NRRL 1555(-)]OAD78641.1 hypothetical protein PHYBLDRAFT_157601 [Phycomyces blakesleeanus NRRL 1555(-)]|eukprot:XP_018296681.1 hypothetical protein PHYBLDRAFT_157601 [Phycomyces blakesleeanus NRRL 1555(-)]